MPATLRYMGSKRSLAPAIAALITREHPRAIVADAFAGTCAVASSVASSHAVVVNDLHGFAAVIGRALFLGPRRKPSIADAVTDLRPAFLQNRAILVNASRVRLGRESRILADDDWEALRDFTIEELEAGTPVNLPELSPLEEYRANPLREPYALFSLLYASSFIGVQQAIDVDSLRFAIARAPVERQDIYLFALLHALSHSAAAPGHFAQHLVPRTEKNTRYIARIRRRAIWERFLSALRDLRLPRCLARAENEVHQLDATEFVRTAFSQRPTERLVIYADPPYSRAQYSRYYHVLETLVRYDYPHISGKGRYREGRFSTEFSLTAHVGSAMDDFVRAAAATGGKLYLSYPRNGLLGKTGTNVLDILSQHFPLAEVARTDVLAHSTLGGAPGTATTEALEDVYYACWP